MLLGADGPLMSSSIFLRIAQSAPVLLPASAATSEASRVA